MQEHLKPKMTQEEFDRMRAEGPRDPVAETAIDQLREFLEANQIVFSMSISYASERTNGACISEINVSAPDALSAAKLLYETRDCIGLPLERALNDAGLTEQELAEKISIEKKRNVQ